MNFSANTGHIQCNEQLSYADNENGIFMTKHFKKMHQVSWNIKKSIAKKGDQLKGCTAYFNAVPRASSTQEDCYWTRIGFQRRNEQLQTVSFVSDRQSLKQHFSSVLRLRSPQNQCSPLKFLRSDLRIFSSKKRAIGGHHLNNSQLLLKGISIITRHKELLFERTLLLLCKFF